MASDAASLGLEVNWHKTKVQALGCREDMPLTIKVQGQDVMVVEEFVYIDSLIHSTTGSTCDISRRSAITRAAMQSLENQIWRSRLAISTKLKLYNTCSLPIFLYGSDCWAISKTDARNIDALEQWCLRMLLRGVNPPLEALRSPFHSHSPSLPPLSPSNTLPTLRSRPLPSPPYPSPHPPSLFSPPCPPLP